MYKKVIKYEDYNGNTREEEFYFHLNKAEIIEMELGTPGGFAEKIDRIVKSQDGPEIIKVFKDLIMRSYGVKSPDGKGFIKVDENGKPLSVAFMQTEAYSELFMELSTNSDEGAKFINGIIPKLENTPATIAAKN